MRGAERSWFLRHWTFVVAVVAVLTVGLVAWGRERTQQTTEDDASSCGRLTSVLAGLSGGVRSVDAGQGSVQWQATTGWADSRPSLGGAQLFVAGTDFAAADTRVTAVALPAGTVRWTRSVGKVRPFRPLPAGDVVLVPLVRPGTVSTAPGERVTPALSVLDAGTGEVVRTLPYRLAGFPESVPVVPGGAAVLNRDAHLGLVELRSGVERWGIDLEAPNADTPVVIDGVLVTRDTNATTYGIDLATGVPRWRVPAESPSVRLADTRSTNRVPPVVLLVAPDALIGLDARTGRERWRVAVQVTAEVSVADGGVVYAVVTPPDQPYGTEMVAVDADADDGSVRWRTTLGGRTSPRLAVGAGVVGALVGDDRLELVGVDRASGAVSWRTPAEGALGPSLLSVRTRFVLAFADGSLRAVTDAGRPSWTDGTSSQAANPPVADEGSVYVSTASRIDGPTDDLDAFFFRC